MLPCVGLFCRFGWSLQKLFRREYYLAANPDVALARVPPVVHFLLFGAFEGRKPNPLFDPEFYLQQNADVAQAEINPLLHYLKWGATEGRRPHPLCEDSLPEFVCALEAPPEIVLYSWWMRQEARLPPPEVKSGPRFSLLLATVRPRLKWIQEAIASVRGQSYPCWELWIHHSAHDEVWEWLEVAANLEKRIHLLQMPRETAASFVLNQMAARSSGDYLVMIGDADRLAPHALRWLAAGAPCDFIYGDEDCLDSFGNRTQPVFKPDWSPDLLLSGMYFGKVAAVGRKAWESVGGLRPGNEEAQEYDLALRLAERSHSRIEHVPRMLYSRRTEQRPSVAEHDASRRSLAEAITRRSIAAKLEDGPRAGCFRLQWIPSGRALASIIVCSRSRKLLDRCLGSLTERTAYACREVIVMQHLTAGADDLQEVIARYGAVRLTYTGPFHFSRMNNMAAKAAKGSILVFLNDDTEILEGSWLDRLVAQAERPDVGLAGACLLYPSGTLQHGGVVIGVGDGCAHAGRNTSQTVSHWPWLDLTRDVAAVTGACLAIRKSLFCELGGFAEEFPVNYNDIDLCLRARESGYRVIYDAATVLRHYECQSRVGVITAEERHKWYQRWATVMAAGDPWYNPNLTREFEDLSLRSPLDQCDSQTIDRRQQIAP